ncbi:DASH complex subunit spc19 [Fusarium oxysporum f. sp. albedinis]|nr:DASH complex subunit spc19 [Fusarium oxysporum f. sp. albedinis]
MPCNCLHQTPATADRSKPVPSAPPQVSSTTSNLNLQVLSIDDSAALFVELLHLTKKLGLSPCSNGRWFLVATIIVNFTKGDVYKLAAKPIASLWTVSVEQLEHISTNLELVQVRRYVSCPTGETSSSFFTLILGQGKRLKFNKMCISRIWIVLHMKLQSGLITVMATGVDTKSAYQLPTQSSYTLPALTEMLSTQGILEVDYCEIKQNVNCLTQELGIRLRCS